MKRSGKLAQREGRETQILEETQHRRDKDDLGEYLVRLYNATTKEALDELMYGGALSSHQKVEKLFWTLLPYGLRTIDHHAKHFRGIVDRWLAGTLTEDDHEDIAVFVLNHRGPKSFEGRTYLRLNPRFIKRYVLGQFARNPLEPMTKAYWELHLLIRVEGEGQRILRPRHCEWCHRLYLPVRKALQKTCSPKCSRLVRYKRYMDRQVATRNSWQQSMEDEDGGGHAESSLEG